MPSTARGSASREVPEALLDGVAPGRAERLAARLVTGAPGHLVSFAADLGSLLLAALLAAVRRRIRQPKGRRA